MRGQMPYLGYLNPWIDFGGRYICIHELLRVQGLLSISVERPKEHWKCQFSEQSLGETLMCVPDNGIPDNETNDDHICSASALVI